MMPRIVWGSPEWIAVAVALLGVSTVAVLWCYGRARARRPVVLSCALLKGTAFTGLALCLIEPLLTGTRARPGANAFAIVVDTSRSMTIRDRGDDRSRGEQFRALLDLESDWQTRVGQDFDVRRYAFDTHLRAVDRFDALRFEGNGTSVGAALSTVAGRFRGLPLAGVLLFTDGNRTDSGAVDWSGLPPVYPVLPRARGVARDVGVSNVSVSQTNFDAAPIVLRADVSTVGLRGQPIVAVVRDEAGNEVARQEATPESDGRPLSYRFQFRPEQSGVSFYSVRAFAADDDEAAGLPGAVVGSTTEQTLENNERLAVVDRGGGPFRVLYVGGRPNWEFKFLRRAVEADRQVELVGLLRIARRQPRFDFQSRRSRTTSPLFDGFDLSDEETAERYDEPVFVRLDTIDEFELRDGFPEAAEDLYRYHAVILDDLESDFFSADQHALVRDFVSVRGGGLLMLGGTDSFADGGYHRTPIGDLLPVYIDRTPAPRPAGRPDYRLVLTREGWLQPWVRTRTTEEDERLRLAAMPPFQTLSRVGDLKPGATVLSQVRELGGELAPALVAQQFGRGHVAALLIGDLWRWGIRRRDPAEDDFDRSWRQTVRWLVADVPDRVELDLRPEPGVASPAVRLTVRVRDPEFRPLDNAKVAVRVSTPDGSPLTLDAEPLAREPGAYATTFATRQPGPHRFVATATAPDGSPLGDREAGWAAQPSADEFARLDPDLAFAETIAEQTGGEVIDPRRLDAFAAGLSHRAAPITEPWISPLWQHPVSFLVAVACLVAEWGLRRINGLA